MTFYSSWPTTEGTRPTTLFQFVGETMHVTCARVSSGMASEGHSIGPQGDIYLAPTGPFVADNSQFAQQAGCTSCQGLVEAQLIFHKPTGEREQGNHPFRRNHASSECPEPNWMLACGVELRRRSSTQQPQVVGDALGKRRSASVMVILCGQPPCPHCTFGLSSPSARRPWCRGN